MTTNRQFSARLGFVAFILGAADLAIPACGGSTDAADAGAMADDAGGGPGGPGGDDAGDAGAGGEDASREEMFRKQVKVVMERLSECIPSQLDQFGGDVEAVEEREFETTLPLLDLPGMTVDFAAQACIDAIASMSCNDFSRFAAFQVPLPAACGFEPTRALQIGEPCLYFCQCATLVCNRPWGASCGVCAEPLGTGQKCDDVNIMFGSPCGVGNVCAGGVCTPLSEAGDQCNVTSAPCFIDLGCVGGTCGELSGRGDPCSALVGECDIQKESLACDPGLKKCVPLKWASAGDECGVKETGIFACSASECFPSILDGTCKAWVADGEACDAKNGPGCQPHAQCVNGICEQFFTPVCE